MPLTQAQLETEVRGRLGDPPEATLPAAQIQRAIAAALREFSRYRPLHEDTTIQIVADQSDYDVEDGVIGAELVAWWPEGVWPELDEIGRMEAAQRTVAKGFWDRLYEGMHAERLETPYECEVIPGTPTKIRILPTPDCAMTAALQLQRARTLEQLTDWEAEILILYIEGDCEEYIGLKRSKSVMQIPTATGALKLDDGSKLRIEGARKKREFSKRLGGGASVATAG